MSDIKRRAFVSAGAGKPGKPAVVDAEDGHVIATTASPEDADRIVRVLNGEGAVEASLRVLMRALADARTQANPHDPAVREYWREQLRGAVGGSRR